MGLSLVLLTPPHEPPLALQVRERLVVLGRGEGVDVSLPEPSVSARHACLKKRGAHYLLGDEGSTNGTAIVSAEGEEGAVYLSPGAPRVLQDGDRVELGHVELAVFGGEPPYPVQWIEDRQELPAVLVSAALAARGLHPSAEELARALRELEGAPDEPLRRALPEEAPPPPPPAPVPEQDPRSTDFVLAAIALVVTCTAATALLWLLDAL